MSRFESRVFPDVECLSRPAGRKLLCSGAASRWLNNQRATTSDFRQIGYRLQAPQWRPNATPRIVPSRILEKCTFVSARFPSVVDQSTLSNRRSVTSLKRCAAREREWRYGLNKP